MDATSVDRQTEDTLACNASSLIIIPDNFSNYIPAKGRNGRLFAKCLAARFRRDFPL